MTQKHTLPTADAGYVFFDGGLGTQLQAAGLGAGERSESWSLTHPDALLKIHEAYLEAGANLLCANTFGVNGLTYPAKGAVSLDALIQAAVGVARQAIAHFEARHPENKEPHMVALDVGPTGRLLAPLGDLDFEEAVTAFAQTIQAGVMAGVDLIAVETMNDLAEARAAVIAAKQQAPHLPVTATVVFDAQGRTLTGADPQTVVTVLEGVGADAVGLNCSLGPDTMKAIVPELVASAHVPVVVCPNAGLPVTVQGQTIYPCDPDSFAEEMACIASMGAGLLGGCCGTTPAHISALRHALEGTTYSSPCQEEVPCLTCRTGTVPLEDITWARLSAEENPAVADAVREEDWDTLVDLAMDAEEEGADGLILALTCDGLDMCQRLPAAVSALQSMVSLPFALDSEDPSALVAGIRCYHGRCGIVWDGSEAQKATFAPAVHTYGAVLLPPRCM